MPRPRVVEPEVAGPVLSAPIAGVAAVVRVGGGVGLGRLVRVLAFGTYDTAAHPRVAVLIDGLRAHGHEVVECNIPLGLPTQSRVDMVRQPWRLPVLAFTVLRRWVGLSRRVRTLVPPDVVLVGYLGQFDVLLARRLFRRTPVVLDLLVSGVETASDRQLGGRLAARTLAWLDRRAVSAADLVVVDTEEHRALVPESRRPDTVVAAVGATDEWFAAGAAAAAAAARTGRSADLVHADGGSSDPGSAPSREVAVGSAGRDRGDTEPLRVVFFGLFTPLQGAPVIGAALRLLSGEPVEVTMIGHGQDLAATKAAASGNERVAWVQWTDPAELPALVAAHDVCLGIFGTSPKALRVVPTKVYQGLAAGTVVVTSDTPPQRRVLDSAALLVPPGDPDALARTLRDLAHDPVRVRALRAASAAAAPRIASATAATADLGSSLETSLPVLRNRP